MSYKTHIFIGVKLLCKLIKMIWIRSFLQFFFFNALPFCKIFRVIVSIRSITTLHLNMVIQFHSNGWAFVTFLPCAKYAGLLRFYHSCIFDLLMEWIYIHFVANIRFIMNGFDGQKIRNSFSKSDNLSMFFRFHEWKFVGCLAPRHEYQPQWQQQQ